eukprot:2982545-Prorocentrum_lima.AAC.1
MTSSLVGSEDVYKRQPLLCTLALRLPRVSKSLFLPSEDHVLAASLSFPVSYTHLTLPTICSV